VRAASIAMMMEAVHTSEISVYFNETTWRYIPEDSKLQKYISITKFRDKLLEFHSSAHQLGIPALKPGGNYMSHLS
jgi:hypothetical protein